MGYEVGELPLERLLPAIAQAEDRLARLDEAVRRSSVSEGFIERVHFFDAVSSLWIAGELLHVEDLVLHDAQMDVRAPTHQLAVARLILRTRRRMVSTELNWISSERGVAALTGTDRKVSAQKSASSEGPKGEGASSPLASQMAHLDAVLERSEQWIAASAEQASPALAPTANKGLPLFEGDWGEAERLAAWRKTCRSVSDYPPSLGAALLFDAWTVLKPSQRHLWLGQQLVSAYLHERGKVTSHFLAFNIGLRTIQLERRSARDRATRLTAILEAMTEAAEAGLKDIIRLQQGRAQMERKLQGRRSSSSLPAVIDLVLARPIVSAGMVAKSANVTKRGALNLIGELGIREVTGRGRYRAWGLL